MKLTLLTAASLSLLASAAMAQSAAPATPDKAPPPPAASSPPSGGPAVTPPPAAAPVPNDQAKGDADDMDDDMAAMDAPKPPPPGGPGGPGMHGPGPRPWPGMMHRRPPSPHIHIAQQNGDTIIDVTCAPTDTTQDCARITLRLIRGLRTDTDSAQGGQGNQDDMRGWHRSNSNSNSNDNWDQD